jgi:choline kinase
MRAVILAAARGSRMGAFAEGRPKCLVELAHQPLIRRQIAALRGGGISHIGIVRGYLGQMIDIQDITYFENPRWAETNMVMSLVSHSALRANDIASSFCWQISGLAL